MNPPVTNVAVDAILIIKSDIAALWADQFLVYHICHDEFRFLAKYLYSMIESWGEIKKVKTGLSMEIF